MNLASSSLGNLSCFLVAPVLTLAEENRSLPAEYS
jgi:hypothetical protein